MGRERRALIGGDPKLRRRSILVELQGDERGSNLTSSAQLEYHINHTDSLSEIDSGFHIFNDDDDDDESKSPNMNGAANVDELSTIRMRKSVSRIVCNALDRISPPSSPTRKKASGRPRTDCGGAEDEFSDALSQNIEGEDTRRSSFVASRKRLLTTALETLEEEIQEGNDLEGSPLSLKGSPKKQDEVLLKPCPGINTVLETPPSERNFNRRSRRRRRSTGRVSQIDPVRPVGSAEEETEMAVANIQGLVQRLSKSRLAGGQFRRRDGNLELSSTLRCGWFGQRLPENKRKLPEF